LKELEGPGPLQEKYIARKQKGTKSFRIVLVCREERSGDKKRSTTVIG
jgi:hypothetical protein